MNMAPSAEIRVFGLGASFGASWSRRRDMFRTSI
jgi:hypothetical protein